MERRDVDKALAQVSMGAASRQGLDILELLLDKHRQDVDNKILNAAETGALSPDKALSFCAEIATYARIKKSLERMGRVGQAAGKALNPAMDFGGQNGSQAG